MSNITTPKFCRDCVHCDPRPWDYPELWKCKRIALSYNPVTGNAIYPECHDERSQLPAAVATQCGFNGRHFVAKATAPIDMNGGTQ